jgi:hypothetical protein
LSFEIWDDDLEIDNGGILITKLYDKHNDFIFPIVKFPFISIFVARAST